LAKYHQPQTPTPATATRACNFSLNLIASSSTRDVLAFHLAQNGHDRNWPKASVTEHPGARKVSEGKLPSKAIEHDG
jgi:hypothetical protein